jgi:hypothetical protein
MKFLLWLYPSAWRNRYGDEFEALLEDQTLHAQDIFDVLWEALKMRVPARDLVRIVIPCGLAGLLVALTIASSAPPRYVSETVMTVRSRLNSRICEDQSDVPMGLQGTSKGVCDEPARSVDQRVRDEILPAFDRDFLVLVIEEMNLYSRERARMPMDRVVDKMQASIHLIPEKGARASSYMHAYDIDFEYSDPGVAQQVNQLLVSQAIESSVKSMVAARSKSTMSAIAPRLKYVRSFGIENAASLPQTPAGLNWVEQSAVGLLGGLLGGLVLAVAIGSRRKVIVAQD